VAWVALAPLLAALAAPARSLVGRRSALRAFLLGLVAGLVYFVGTIYWTGTVVRQYGDLPGAVATGLMLLLSAYLALYPAVFAVIVHRLVGRYGMAGLLLAPAAWVTSELGRAYLFTGFPWVLLGYSQTSVLPLAQLASVTGVYGLSALVAFVNAALVLLVLDRSHLRWSGALVAVATVAVVAVWGSARIADGRLTREGVPYRVGLAQGNIPQDEKWDRGRALSITRNYFQLTHEAAAGGAAFIVWPESALPVFFEEDRAVGDSVRSLAIDTGSYLLFGGDQVERAEPSRYYNSAFLIDPRGAVAGVYRKMHLVPFGEYVPLKRLLFFAGPLVESVGGFSEGDRVVMLPVSGHPVSTAICYEVVYPDLARRATAAGSQLLTTITNDAWYGRSSAPWQHFQMASLRAVEQGRYLARAANTGISGIVDPYGRVVARTNLFERQVLVGEIRFLSDRTPYARYGDVFAYACALATLAALLMLFSRERGLPWPSSSKN
jgi:apolipoprotein N-acyltransferase